MKELKIKYFIAVNAAFILSGILLVMFGIVMKNDIASPLLDSIGTGLIAAGLVNIFDRAITLEPVTIEAKQRIEVVAEQRLATPKEILNLKYSADKVDLIGINLNYFMEELVNDSTEALINRLIYNHLQLRIFLVHPDSPYLVQRALEDGISPQELVQRQKQTIRYCARFYDQLVARYNTACATPHFDAHNLGILHIKLLTFCPYITVYRINEDQIYWGLYTSNRPGVGMPLFKTDQARDPQLYKRLHEHIHGLIERDKGYPDLVSMTEMGRPEMNSILLASATAAPEFAP